MDNMTEKQALRMFERWGFHIQHYSKKAYGNKWWEASYRMSSLSESRYIYYRYDDVKRFKSEANVFKMVMADMKDYGYIKAKVEVAKTLQELAKI